MDRADWMKGTGHLVVKALARKVIDNRVETTLSPEQIDDTTNAMFTPEELDKLTESERALSADLYTVGQLFFEQVEAQIGISRYKPAHGSKLYRELDAYTYAFKHNHDISSIWGEAALFMVSNISATLSEVNAFARKYEVSSLQINSVDDISRIITRGDVRNLFNIMMVPSNGVWKSFNNLRTSIETLGICPDELFNYDAKSDKISFVFEVVEMLRQAQKDGNQHPDHNEPENITGMSSSGCPARYLQAPKYSADEAAKVAEALHVPIEYLTAPLEKNVTQHMFDFYIKLLNKYAEVKKHNTVAAQNSVQ